MFAGGFLVGLIVGSFLTVLILCFFQGSSENRKNKNNRKDE